VTGQTVGGAVATQEPQPIVLLRSYQDRFAVILPDHIEAKQFVGLAAAALYRDPALMTAANNNPGAFANVMLRCASLGHQPGTEEFYLIPFKNKRNNNKTEIQGIEGYRGIIERMYRSGAVASVIVREVCEHDRFRFTEGVHDRPIHSWDIWHPENRGPMIGVYGYAGLNTGAVSRVAILSAADVMAARANSAGAESATSPWNRMDAGKDLPQFMGRSMWWKTAARRLEPWVPTSAEYRREQLRAAVAAENERRVNAPTVVQVPPEGLVDSDGVIHEGELVDEPTAEEKAADERWLAGEKPTEVPD
jgi:recombination protein RecT